jgi:hypothetical protein
MDRSERHPQGQELDCKDSPHRLAIYHRHRDHEITKRQHTHSCRIRCRLNLYARSRCDPSLLQRMRSITRWIRDGGSTAVLRMDAMARPRRPRQYGTSGIGTV